MVVRLPKPGQRDSMNNIKIDILIINYYEYIKIDILIINYSYMLHIMRNHIPIETQWIKMYTCIINLNVVINLIYLYSHWYGKIREYFTPYYYDTDEQCWE